MVFDDETEFSLNENTASNKTEPQLEKYGVWVKKGPETLESPQEIPEIDDVFSQDTTTDDTFVAPEQEQIESIDEELDSLMDEEPTKPSIPDSEVKVPVSESVPTAQIDADLGLPKGLDIPGIDLSAFENNDIAVSPSDSSGEVSIDMDDFFSSDSGDGEVDLSSFFGDGDSIDFDDFMGGEGTKKEPEIVDEEPLDIQLEFDDNFVLETKADPVSQVEFVGFDGESGEMSFDDLFDNIQDEGNAFPNDFESSASPKIPDFDPNDFVAEDLTSAFMSDDTPDNTPTPEVLPKSDNDGFDDASEFDDLLSSLDEATPLTETPEEAKAKKLTQDYDITVTMDEEDLTEDDEEEEDTNNDDLDDISLFQSNEDIENFKQLSKNHGSPVGGMKVLEAQSSMDFDEIDKILEEGDFSFPSDEVKDVASDEISEVSIDDVAKTDVSNDEVSLDLDSLELDSVNEDLSEDNSLQENFIADDIVSNNDDELLPDNNLDISEPILEDTDIEDNISFEEEQTETENAISFEDDSFDDNISFDNTNSVEESIDTQSSFEEENVAFEEEIQEEDLKADDRLDETFSEIQESDQVEDGIEENQIIQDTTDDDLLDMDFSEEITENVEETNEVPTLSSENVLDSEEENTNENNIQETNEETIVEEQGEITMQENNIMNNEQIEQKEDSTSTALLEKIAAEITNLRSEITNLRSEFNSLKTAPVQHEDDISVQQDESSGFFSDDNEDETIALSGDELSNLMNNADFTTENAEAEDQVKDNEIDSESNLNEEDVIENDNPETTEEIQESSDEHVLDSTIDEIEDTTVSEPEIEQETLTNPLGDATELTDSDLDTMDEYEEDSFADSGDVSNFADEDLQEPELDELQMDSNFDENDEDLQEEIEVPKDDAIDDEPETNDFIESINAEEPTISETLTEDRLKYLEDSVENGEPDQDEILEEDSIIKDSEEESVAPTDNKTEEVAVDDESEATDNVADEAEEDETEESSEPTEDVFNSSQWDNEVPATDDDFVEPQIQEPELTESEEVVVEDKIASEDEVNFVAPISEESQEEIVEEDESLIEDDKEEVENDELIEDTVASVEPVEQNSSEQTQVAKTSPTAKIQDDIKSVLVYMDQLLENLPEDKIEEFAKSEHFDTYKKLFNDLGISN